MSWQLTNFLSRHEKNNTTFLLEKQTNCPKLSLDCITVIGQRFLMGPVVLIN